MSRKNESRRKEKEPFFWEEGVVQPFAPSVRRWERQQAGRRKRAVMTTAGETKNMKFLMMKKKNNKKTPLVKKTERMAGEKIGLYIPVDIVSEILLNLPAKSLGKFRRVSKSWLSITSNTAFIRANAQRSRIIRHSLIIGSKMRPKRICLASAEATISKFSIRLREYHPLKPLPEYSYAVASCDGLVCLYSNTQSHVINPLTRQSIPLPKDGVFLTCNLGFYFHRSTSKYRLIRFMDTMRESEVLVVGESSWRRIPGNLPAFFHCPYPLDLNGNIYWLAHSRNETLSEDPPDTVVIFDEEKEVYSVISLPPFEKLHHLGGHLMDFNGELGLWLVDKNNTIDVWIMKDVWTNRYTFSYAQIHGCPSPFDTRWLIFIGRAITIGDEELIVKLSRCKAIYCNELGYLLRCNLKSGACVVQTLSGQFSLSFCAFPYMETLINPQCSSST
ncbi:putative F-box protein [Platanthera zijinensis]|uniref:F-box protein n=1 Tax=Platanthera zijinensis TaxID=2320716 RepID=A0AAP0BKS2_9ASPA